MEYRFKHRILNRRISNEQEIFKELFNIFNNQRNTNQNDFVIQFHLSEWLRLKKW